MISRLYHSKLVRYGFIGGVSTLIHLAIAFLWLYYATSSILMANMIGFIIAFIFSYSIQSLYVFVHPLSYAKAFKYFIVQFGALLLSILISNTLSEFSPYFKTVIVIAIMPLITFLIHKGWTFSHQQPKGAS